jgi:hypothetical protein
LRPTTSTTLLLLLLPIAALRADTGTATASTSALLEGSTKAKRVDDPPLLAVAGVQEDGLTGSCSLYALNQSSPRKGVKGTFDAVLIDANTGSTVADLGRKKGKTNKNGELTVDYPIPRSGSFAQLVAMVVELNLGGGKKITDYEFSCQLVDETL